MTSPRTVTVGDESFTARIGIVIATGSQLAIPPIPGLADVDLWTTHDVIQAATLPKSLIVLGGGGVGCEPGQMLSRFGVEVTIVEAGDRLLPTEEPEASATVNTASALLKPKEKSSRSYLHTTFFTLRSSIRRSVEIHPNFSLAESRRPRMLLPALGAPLN